MLGANIFAMDDLLQSTIRTIPQLRIIANGVYKAACSGGITSCAYLSLSTVHIDILTIPRRLFHFKQHIVTDVDLGAGNCTVISAQRTFLAVNVHYNFSGRISGVNIPTADAGISKERVWIDCSIVCINGNIVLYVYRYISLATSNR